MRKISLALTFVLLALPVSAADAPRWDCPEELRPAVEAKRVELQAFEYSVRDSAADRPVRVELTEIFDLAAHECHTGRTQAWRIFGEPSCEPGKDAGVYRVTYPYELSFRRGVNEEAMYKAKWDSGSDGLWQVTFEKGISGWAAMGQREVLDLGGSDMTHKHREEMGGKP